MREGDCWALLNLLCLWTSVPERKVYRLLDMRVEFGERTMLEAEFGVRDKGRQCWGSQGLAQSSDAPLADL